MTPASLSIDVPSLLLGGSASEFNLKFTSSIHLCLPDPSWLVDLKWRELEIVRGSGFCLRIEFRWNGQHMDEVLVEELGRWISRAEMWTQLLFSASLKVPERVQIGIDSSDGEGPDVIIVLVRTSQLSAATELLIPKILPTAFLSDITLDFLFSLNGPHCSYETPPRATELMPYIDEAIRGLWNNKIAQLAPILGKIGYLESVSQKSEYIAAISDAIINVGEKSQDKSLERSIERMMVNGGMESKIWGCLLRISGESKGRTRDTLKSLMAVKGELTTERSAGEEERRDILLLYEKDFEGEDKKEELFFDEVSADENSLFTWDEEGECGEGGGSDSLFVWEDEGDSSLFGAPGGPPKDLKHFANKNDHSSSDDYEPETLFEFETFPQCVEDGDMILI